MLFHSSVKKELSRTFGASLVVLITVVMTMMLIRVLFLANRGRVNPAEVLLVMGYFVLGHLPTILALCLFIAIVATLSRMYRDSEMVIWFGSGRGLTSLLRPLVSFSWPVCVVIAVLALFVWPWTNEQTQNLRIQFEQRSDLERIAPGTFQESAKGNRVFFIDKDTSIKQVKPQTGVQGQVLGSSNIFISEVTEGKESVTTARSGQFEMRDGKQYLILKDGKRIETNIASGQTKVSSFSSYASLVKSVNINPFEGGPSKTKSSMDLVTTPTPNNLGELAWRLGLAFCAINFIILGIAISSGNGRSSRNGSFLFALLAFAFYYNLINLSQSWIASGNYSFWGLLIVLHGGALAVGALWLTKRHNNWSLRSWLRMRTSKRNSTEVTV
ncbi:MAG TPA: LPS export ABC transporter permease LptF [Burkholderiaceae bacterium]|nr:LPS export ABC transporter permease LptF [Burkholderiaceae bacterium]